MTKNEALKKAFKQAFQLGQDYWYQADHEYESQNKKSDVTRAKFEQLMEDAIKEALAQPESEYERGFIDGMQKQMQSSVDKAVNAMSQRNDVLEEVAKEIEKMKAFEKDTMASFVAYIRGMKR